MKHVLPMWNWSPDEHGCVFCILGVERISVCTYPNINIGGGCQFSGHEGNLLSWTRESFDWVEAFIQWILIV